MTPQQIEAMKLALEALTIQSDRVTEIGKKREAITAIKEALAQPEQEPVVHDPLPRACNLAGVDYQTFLKIKAYMPVAPPQRTEPVIDQSAAIRIATALGWTPPRTWVGLTDEEVSEVFGGDIHAEHSGELRFVRAIEAKLKERNQ